MSDIFEEVEEAHRKDRVDAAWRRYGWIVWLAGAGVVLAVALNEYLGWQRSQAQATVAGELEAALDALDAADYEAAATRLEAIVAEDGTLAPLAAQYLAQARLSGQGNREDAIAALEAVASGSGDPLAQMALLKAAYLEADALSLADLEAQLAPLIGKDTPMAALARELVAAKAFADGDIERARREFNFLRFAPNAPPGLAQRAEIALSAIPRPAAGDDAAAATGSDGEGAASRLSQGQAGTAAEEAETSATSEEEAGPEPGGGASDTDDLGGQ